MSDEESPPVIGPEATGQTKVSGLAIASLICALLIPPVGLILAIVALRSMKANPAIGGKGVAVAGVVVSSLFTLIFTVLTVVLVIVAIPNIQEARKEAQTSACKANLKTIEMAIAQRSLENRKADDAEVTLEDIVSWMNDGILPRCPSGGEYELFTVEDKPTCTIIGHTIDPYDPYQVEEPGE